MKKILLLLTLFSSFCFGQADWLSSAGMTQVMNGVDDGTYHVSLGHSFPYFGGTFTDAWMSSNGVIMLYDPTTQFGNTSRTNSMCCNGVNFSTSNNSGYSFMLAPLWTDLRHDTSVAGSGYFYKTNEGVSSFLWRDVKEYGTNNLNTFQANLWPDGSFDFQYDDVNITSHTVTIGFSGNLAFGDYEQMEHQSGYSNNNLLSATWWDNLVNPGGVEWYGQDGGYESSVDCTDPLTNAGCPGYAEAYYDYQCSLDALYDSGCPGYAEAYFDYQCELDGLYDSQCPGYQGALASQNAAGTNFVYGDDISDFIYDTSTENDFTLTEDTSYGYTDEFASGSTYGDESESLAGYEQLAEETFNDSGTLYSEELGEVYTELPVEAEELFSNESVVLEEETMGADPISEDFAVVEEVFEEELLAEEVIDVVEETEANGDSPSVDAVSLALNEVSKVEQLAQSMASQSSSMSSTSTFGAMDSLIEEATIEMLSDPTIVTIEVASQTSENEEQTADFQMESSTPQTDTGFAAQQDQSFSTGQSITAVLNNVAPNFSQFDVAPPSQTEQRQTAKAEAAANNMSQEDLEASMESMSGDMQDSGGFTDQSLTIFLMGRVNGFDQYTGQLQDVSFYVDRGMPGGQVQNDRNSMLRMIGIDDKHARMVAEQYQ